MVQVSQGPKMQIKAMIRDHHLLINLGEKLQTFVKIPIWRACAMDACLKGILHCENKILWCKTLGHYIKLVTWYMKLVHIKGN